jgi:hypothetical protein
MQGQANEFFRQLTAVVLATLLFVASVAFLSIPAALGCNPGAGDACAVSALERHLT